MNKMKRLIRRNQTRRKRSKGDRYYCRKHGHNHMKDSKIGEKDFEFRTVTMGGQKDITTLLNPFTGGVPVDVSIPESVQETVPDLPYKCERCKGRTHKPGSKIYDRHRITV